MIDFMRVKLTDQEVMERGSRLAHCLRELTLHDEEQKQQREQAALERKELVRQVQKLADAVRTGMEDRSTQLGMWPDDKPSGG